MADQSLTVLRLAIGRPSLACAAALLAAVSACAGPPPPVVAAPPATPVTFTTDPRPRRFHSARFELTVPLPDGRAWQIDDHRTPLLVATHPATGSTLSLGLSAESQLMNRQRCEAIARERGLVHDDSFQTVADEVIVGPGPYDSHVVVSALPSPLPHHTLSGHVFLFGSYIRKCLFVHYETRQKDDEDEAMLSARLAVARLQILGGIRVEAFDRPELPPRR